MKIVNTVKRIDMLNKALARTPMDEKYEDLWDAMLSKRTQLRFQLKAYKEDQSLSKEDRYQRKHAIKTACRLLNIDSKKIMSANYLG